MSPDVFLSQKLRVVDLPGIRYDGSGLKGSPSEIVANLVLLNTARLAPVYHTPNFTAVATNPNTTAPTAVKLETVAMEAYYKSLGAGDPAAVHKAVDTVNMLRSVKSGVELVPPSDFDIISHSDNSAGESARWLSAERDGAAQVFWSDDGAAILSAYTG